MDKFYLNETKAELENASATAARLTASIKCIGEHIFNVAKDEYLKYNEREPHFSHVTKDDVFVNIDLISLEENVGEVWSIGYYNPATDGYGHIHIPPMYAVSDETVRTYIKREFEEHLTERNGWVCTRTETIDLKK